MAQKLNDTKFVTSNMTNIIANNNQLHGNCITWLVANDMIYTSVLFLNITNVNIFWAQKISYIIFQLCTNDWIQHNEICIFILLCLKVFSFY
jgi:hypothetical protein